MQKIVYIVQEFVNPFNPPFEYKWNYYGVYSEELAGEVNIGEFFNIFKETPVIEYNYQSYAIEIPGDAEMTGAEQNVLLGSLMAFLNDQEPRLLEVLSSIIFFEKKGLSEEEINAQLLKFKGHLHEFFDDAYEALEKIKEILSKQS
ncbi:MAG: hypothetical protein WDA53_07400 [Bacillota bacterium]